MKKIILDFKNMKLRRKLTIAMGGILFISMGVLILFSTYNFRKNSEKAAKELADVMAEHYGGHIENKIGYAITNAKVMAELIEEYELLPGKERREYFSAEMKKIEEKNPEFLSVWIVAEQNSIDNRDNEFIGKDGNTDTGRFVTGWYREKGEIKISGGTELEITNQDYYKIPKQKKSTVILEPYLDSYYEGAPEILMTSVIVPVIKNGEYKGEVGIDISLEFFKEFLKDGNPFETGAASVISNNLNEVMKRLTTITIILMIPTLISSMFGMNLPNFMEHNSFAFVGVFLTSIVITIISVLFFRWRKWF